VAVEGQVPEGSRDVLSVTSSPYLSLAADRATSLLQTMVIPVTPTFFHTLKDNIAMSGSDLGLSIATEPSLPLSAPLLRMSISEDTVIPNSLIMVLDAAYLFHLLARDPQKVVAPGKSLLSVLAGLNLMVTSTLESPSEKFVRKRIHQAFWDQVSTYPHTLNTCSRTHDFTSFQVIEALSSPLPSSQIGRLKGLYRDLHEALTPLFPSKHPALVPFSLPLPPTSSPLIVAITHLRDTLVTLRQRCAPVRDATIDGILHRITHRSPSTSTEELAELLVIVIRSILELSIDMRNDYSNAVLTTASEQELADIVATMAQTQEQELVLQFWESKETMQKAWTHWMDGFHPADPAAQVQPKQFWILKLIESLGKPHAVTSKLFRSSFPQGTINGPNDGGRSTKQAPEPPNVLPPQFLFSGPTLFHLQNYIQALTIAASLKSLVPTPRLAFIPPTPSQSRMGDLTFPADQAFIERIWALLEPEIGAFDGEPSETKIINFADEVVMAHSSALPSSVTTLDPHFEQRLRSTVDRILRTDDPVFILLQKRLLAALSAAFLNTPVVEEHATVRMHSGSRALPQRGISSPSPPHTTQSEINIVAKGFEDPVIAKQCSVAASMLKRSVEWVERVWGDTMPY